MAFMAKRTLPKGWDLETARARFQEFRKLVEEHECTEDGFVFEDADDGELMLTFAREENGKTFHRTMTVLPPRDAHNPPTIQFLADTTFDVDLIFQRFSSPEPNSVFYTHA